MEIELEKTRMSRLLISRKKYIDINPLIQAKLFVQRLDEEIEKGHTIAPLIITLTLAVFLDARHRYGCFRISWHNCFWRWIWNYGY